jgi:hypothetical protein
MDISTLQSLLNSSARLLERARSDDMFESGSDIDYNYALGVEHGVRQAIRLVQNALDNELEARDNDVEWIDYVVRSAIENNSFNGDYISWDGAYDEAAEELDVDHNALCDAFDRVSKTDSISSFSDKLRGAFDRIKEAV